ncbi:MAG: NAD(+) diphosphatase [Eubacteriales bacterium]|nr:NAD(+) diphosphatase [Eubacteriales bacterium]
MIQEIAPHIYHNEYRPTAPSAEDYVMICRKGELFLREKEGQISYLTVQETEAACPGSTEQLIYLFQVDERHFFLLKNADQKLTSLFTEFAFCGLRMLRQARPKHLAFAGVTAYQLFRWYENHKFCGHCGRPMKQDAKERMMFCESCGLQEFPKICPAVIVGIRNGDKILMSKYEGREHKHYALIAGFAEIGETIEETVHREVMEEVGLKVKNLTFYRSQPWSFSDTLLMGFYCDLDGDDRITLDRTELAVAEWKSREEIEGVDEDLSLTGEMMLRFKRGLDREPYLK